MKTWKTHRLGQLNHFITSGSRGWAEFYASSGPVFLRITNLERNTIKLDLSDLKYVRLPASSAEGIRTKVKPDDILISITAELGLIGLMPSSFSEEAYVNQHIALLRISASRLTK